MNDLFALMFVQEARSALHTCRIICYRFSSFHMRCFGTCCRADHQAERLQSGPAACASNSRATKERFKRSFQCCCSSCIVYLKRRFHSTHTERKEKRQGSNTRNMEFNKYLHWSGQCNMFGILQRSRLLQFKLCVNHLLSLSSGSPTDFGNWLQGFFCPINEAMLQTKCLLDHRPASGSPPSAPFNDRISRLCPAVFVSDSLIFTAQFLTATDQVCNVTKYFFGGICVSLLQTSTNVGS